MFGSPFERHMVTRKILYSLLPVFLFSIYLYGLRVIAVTGAALLFGILTDYAIAKWRHRRPSEAVVLTCVLYSLSLPPLTPLLEVATGIVVAVALTNGIEAVFGQNLFNKANLARFIAFIAFPAVMTSAWMVPGNFGMSFADVVSGATPLAILKHGGTLDLMNMIIGLRPGSIGESPILLILLSASYLAVTGTAQWRLMLSTVLGAAALGVLLWFTGVSRPDSLQYEFMAGSLLFVSVWMVTDEQTAPKKPLSQWVYGLVIGAVTILVRTLTGIPEGTSIGLLVGNVLASLLDEMLPGPRQDVVGGEIIR